MTGLGCLLPLLLLFVFLLPLNGFSQCFSRSATIVVPCYNEERRLPVAAFLTYVQARASCSTALTFLFVNDGSTDGTASVLDSLNANDAASFQVLHLQNNVGKAEAVRAGLIQALHAAAPFSSDGETSEIVGYWDGDLATPLSSIDIFMKVFETVPRIDMVFGSRVALLGRDIQRHASRHYLGRVFATMSSWVLDLRIYDTQCGAKLFKASTGLQLALKERFQSRWIFDVELIARLQVHRHHVLNEWINVGRGKGQGQGKGKGQGKKGTKPFLLSKTIYESPLDSWRDISGSKLSLKHKASALYGLFYIWEKYASPWKYWDPVTGLSVHSGQGDRPLLFVGGVAFILIVGSVAIRWCCCCVCNKNKKNDQEDKEKTV